MVSGPAVRLNTLLLHKFPAWLSLRSSALVSGQVSVNTTLTAASCVLMSSPLLVASFLPNAGVYGSSGTPSQKSLSAEIEAKVCHQLLDPASHDRHRVAHLSLNRIPKARSVAFLPFRIPSHPTSRPLCVSGQLTSPSPHAELDPRYQLHSLRPGHGSSRGDHALVCGCGGDRVTRHNLVRDVVHSAANDRASLGAVLEKPGLLHAS